MAAAVGRDTLPEHWSYGVCRDGRVFFIDDRTRSTTWLHPRTGEPVNSGHMIRSGACPRPLRAPRHAPRDNFSPLLPALSLCFPVPRALQTCPADGRRASRRRAPATSSKSSCKQGCAAYRAAFAL
ncbi:hypothetical protein Nmel_006420 [Mimus melanotis]